MRSGLFLLCVALGSGCFVGATNPVRVGNTDGPPKGDGGDDGNDDGGPGSGNASSADGSSADGGTSTSDPSAGSAETSTSGETETEGVDPNAPWFEIGTGTAEFTLVEDGGQFPIVLGGQGLYMWPMPLRAGNFGLPDDPMDFTDPKAPMLDLEMDIDGYNNGPGGHFKRIANYPIPFRIQGDGSFEFIYVAVIVPDGVTPEELDGKSTDLWIRLRPYDTAPIERSYTLTIEAP